MKAVLKWLRLDSDGKDKSDDSPVFLNFRGKKLKDFRNLWVEARKTTTGSDLRFHDLRGEYASRLVEKGVPLSQVRDLLGHASIVTTERYDRRRFELLEAAAKKLETGEAFKIPSSLEKADSAESQISNPIPQSKSLSIQ